VGTAAAIVIFVGNMSVTLVLWPVHVFMTYKSIARFVFTISVYGVESE
jgi:hypothetical protein